MPPEASSCPEIGLNFIDTSTSEYGPGGATMTLNVFLVARCTSTFLPLGAPAMSSTAHCPSTVVQPSIPFASKANLLVGTLSGTLNSSAASAARNRGNDHAPATSAATVVLNVARRVTFMDVRSYLGSTTRVPCMFGVCLVQVMGQRPGLVAVKVTRDFSTLDDERVDKARYRRWMHIAVDPDDLQRHRLALAHHDSPRGPLVGHDLPPPIRVRRCFSVAFAPRQRGLGEGLLILLGPSSRLDGCHVDHAPLGLRPWRVSPDGRQCQGEQDGRRPTSYVPRDPHISHDSPPTFNRASR